MSNVGLLVKGELYKTIKNRKLWFFFIFIICLVTISGAKTLGDLETQQQVLRSSTAVYQDFMHNSISSPEIHSVLGFVKKSISITWVINIVMIIMASSIISNEYSWGTIKYLAVRPFKREKILIAKFSTIIILNILFYMIIISYSYLVGIIIHGFETQVAGEKLYYITLKLYLYHFISNIPYISLSIMVSTLLKSGGLASTLSIITSILGGMIASVINKYPYAKYILFTNTDLAKYVQGGAPTIGGNEFFSVMIIFVYSFFFLIISLYIFKKRSI
ncbi:hypothetical protein BBG47_00450 [Paenibacillus sp. KS1]|uniref:ABC transporter permease subunit n=1 Tax=Paenibacillus sp. KS1 TaxID=1849249 RepID=UPI0008065DC5|nr:ABC transporter permease subunit [Paenibacillus sp. KS1]OBY81584.1 hypothetical protein BBG47_00450 [Paenibacillus sp. KS1]